MRIISGAHKGRRIELLKEATDHVRPTSDFAREAIFNIINHRNFDTDGHPYMDQPVLDVFSGTGALGLEALSRGASEVTFVDKSREALANARYNATRMKEEARTRYVHTDATRMPKAKQPYGLVFLDPPYFKQLLPKTLQSLAQTGWLKPNALIIIEHDSRDQFPMPEDYNALDTRRYGRAVIQLATWKAPQ